MLLAVAVAALAAASGAHAREPGAVVRREAEASWTVRDPSGRHDSVEYWLWVRRLTKADRDVTMLRLTRYVCDRVASGTTCRPTFRIDKTIPNDAFELSEALDSASVRFRAHGRVHSATWTATSDPGRSELDSYCGSLPVAGNVGRGVGRAAIAEGNVLGRRVTTADDGPGEDGYLSLMVEARTC